MDAVKELFALFEKENCDYGRCRELIREIGGCTVIVEDKHGLKTTPLHEAVSSGHYDFAHELIGEDGADLDVDPDGSGTVLWDLQYLYSETEEEQCIRFETRHLWERSFADPKTFIDLYFREKYRKERNETIVRDGRVVAALQKLPYPLTYGGRMLPASYISGACTDENYRRRGLMGELLVQSREK